MKERELNQEAYDAMRRLLLHQEYVSCEADINTFLNSVSERYYRSLLDDTLDYYEGCNFYEDSKHL